MPAEVEREHGAESYGSGSQILRRWSGNVRLGDPQGGQASAASPCPADPRRVQLESTRRWCIPRCWGKDCSGPVKEAPRASRTGWRMVAPCAADSSRADPRRSQPGLPTAGGRPTVPAGQLQPGADAARRSGAESGRRPAGATAGLGLSAVLRKGEGPRTPSYTKS
jgi:hypothetical protein